MPIASGSRHGGPWTLPHGAALDVRPWTGLGTAPELREGGVNVSPEEDRPGGERVALLSSGLWQSQFGGDANVIGRRISLDGTVRSMLPRCARQASRMATTASRPPASGPSALNGIFESPLNAPANRRPARSSMLTIWVGV